MHRFSRFIVLMCASLALFLNRGQAESPASAAVNWREILAEVVPEYGHRNWIVIADSAYPSQTQAGIETVPTGAEQLLVLKAVLEEISKTKHVRPKIYLDSELPFVSEKKSHGIDKYRADLKTLLGDRKIESHLHEKIIEKLDNAGQTFKVLVLKTNFTIPYTSVFIELDCGYWSDESEKALRKAMADAAVK